jgi:hypothetical protein
MLEVVTRRVVMLRALLLVVVVPAAATPMVLALVVVMLVVVMRRAMMPVRAWMLSGILDLDCSHFCVFKSWQASIIPKINEVNLEFSSDRFSSMIT